jgi:hypothetical protein
LFANAAKQESPAAHVTAAGKLRGNYHPPLKDFSRRAQILRGCHAAEKDNTASSGKGLGNQAKIAPEWLQVSRFVDADGDLRHSPQIMHTHSLLRRHEPSFRGDDEYAARPSRRIGENPRVGELTPKVEPAEKREHVTEGHSHALAQRARKSKGCSLVEE